MANVVFNVARGRARQLVLDGADLIVVLLKTAQADDSLRDHDTLAALLSSGGGSDNVEANFTNYERKVVSNGSVTNTVDDTANDADLDIPDQTWAAAGGGTDNTLAKAIVCIDGASDAARIPVTAHDFTPTTDGSDLIAQIATDGFYKSN